MTEIYAGFPPFPIQAAKALTIGFFDGVHLGHQYLIEQMCQTKQEGEKIAIVTFTDHPLFFLKGKSPPLLTHPSQKLQLLQQLSLDLIFLFSFDKGLRQLSYEEFLGKIYKNFPFKHLFLGKGARFGKEQQGEEIAVTTLGKKWGFKTHYIPLYQQKELLISSSQIRKSLQEKQLSLAQALLGRPYRIWIEKPDQGFFSIEKQLLPPPGVYLGKDPFKHPCQIKILNAHSLTLDPPPSFVSIPFEIEIQSSL